MSALDKLTDKQKKFVLEYASDMDRERAMREAGYTGTSRTLGVRAVKLLKNPRVKEAIAEVGQPIMERANLTTERILTQLHDLLFFDPAELFDEQGYLTRDLSELPPGVRQAIKSFEVEEQYDREGNLVGTRIKVSTVSKEKMLELAMRYKRLFEETSQTTNIQVNFWDQIYEQKVPMDDGLEHKLKAIDPDG